ncbi:hypothetical protein [Exiguobacterium sp.]|uniref:hypothetical protein n=2 Tax=unclassified Exiguobacterium TaxID=2644629 RepID=UPI00263B7DB8|nr:hypothetical protein [Exiguobacterium sp.]MCC5893476.1 hypothetical protein [Exiguobacterium sp.]
MNPIYPNQQRKKKRYLYAFLLLALLNTVQHVYDMSSDMTSVYRLVGGLIFYAFLIYFGLRGKKWAEIAIAIVVWINVIALSVILLFMGLSLIA